MGPGFFKVQYYRPRFSRPSCSCFTARAIKYGLQFQKFGDGTTSRDYTYIDDIVSGIISALETEKEHCAEIYNLGNSSPVSLNEFIRLCEEVTGKKALYQQIEMQKGDVPHTYADISKAKRDLDYDPKTSLKDGLLKFYKSL